MSMERSARLVFHALLMLAILAFVAAPADAGAQRRRREADTIDRTLQLEEDDPARDHFFAAVTLYESGDREAALEEFRSSFAEREEPVVAYNIAQVLRELRVYDESLLWFRRYLEIGGESISRSRRRQISTLVRRLERTLVPVTFEVTPSGAEVLVDERSVGRAPFERPVMLAPGRRRVDVRAESHEPVTAEVRLRPRRPVSLEYTLAEIDVQSTLRLTADPPSAVILVDGVPVGEGQVRAAVERGGHVIEARQEGYAPYRAAVSVGDRQDLELHVALERHEEPWETWWFWTIVGVVVVGTAAGVTAGVIASQ